MHKHYIYTSLYVTTAPLALCCRTSYPPDIADGCETPVFRSVLRYKSAYKALHVGKVIFIESAEHVA